MYNFLCRYVYSTTKLKKINKIKRKQFTNCLYNARKKIMKCKNLERNCIEHRIWTWNIKL